MREESGLGADTSANRLRRIVASWNVRCCIEGKRRNRSGLYDMLEGERIVVAELKRKGKLGGGIRGSSLCRTEGDKSSLKAAF